MNQNDDKRRSFLKHVVAGTAGVAGSALLAKKAKAQNNVAKKRPDEVLYKKTDAFKQYYESLR